MASFYQTLTDAIRDISEHGFDTQRRLDVWMEKIRQAAHASLISPKELDEQLRRALGAIYSRMVVRGSILEQHHGVSRMRLDRIKPSLRAELDRRIMASANLIKLNRQQAIDQTLQRFSGWSTSIPKGGSRIVDKTEEKSRIRKSLAALPFEERRVIIDQGHKFTANLSQIMATDNDAIGATWHSHWKESGYNYREDHKERDKIVYVVRGCWAIQKGFIKASSGYTDEIDQPAEAPYCRCYFSWIYNLADMPQDMLTQKGRDEIERTRRLIRTL